jgi:hypothetical protein
VQVHFANKVTIWASVFEFVDRNLPLIISGLRLEPCEVVLPCPSRCTPVVLEHALCTVTLVQMVSTWQLRRSRGGKFTACLIYVNVLMPKGFLGFNHNNRAKRGMNFIFLTQI